MTYANTRLLFPMIRQAPTANADSAPHSIDVAPSFLPPMMCKHKNESLFLFHYISLYTKLT